MGEQRTQTHINADAHSFITHPGARRLFVAPADENKRVTRLCEVQDGSSSVSVCGLSLAPSSLNPLLRALKLQASLTELRISGNRLHDNLLPELVATTITMPRLRLLDISASHITGEGLEKAVNALKGQSHPAYPVKSPAGLAVINVSCCWAAFEDNLVP